MAAFGDYAQNVSLVYLRSLVLAIRVSAGVVIFFLQVLLYLTFQNIYTVSVLNFRMVNFFTLLCS